MNKAQSFGYDLLFILISLIIFGEIFYIRDIHINDNLLSKGIENEQVIYLALSFNNSLFYFNDYICNGDLNSFLEFNNTIENFFKTYLQNRNYIFMINGIKYGETNICLNNARPVFYTLNSTCETIINVAFNIYTNNEVGTNCH